MTKVPEVLAFVKETKYAWLIALMLFIVPVPHLKTIGAEQASQITGENQSIVTLSFGSSLGSRLLTRVAGIFQKAPEGSSGMRMDVVTLSGCPFGKRFVKDTLPQIVEAYPEMDWHVWYLTSKNGDTYSSMHGQAELDENVREMCIWEKYGREKWLDFVVCHYARNDFQGCAKENGIDTNLIENCKDGEGTRLLEESYKKSMELGATGTPTIVFNDGESRIVGARPFSDFNKTIFELLTGETIVEPEVKMVVISPGDCPDEICNPGWVANSLRSQYGTNIKLEVIDPDRTNLDEMLGARGYPIFLFDRAIENSSAYGAIGRYLTPAGNNMYVLATRPSVLNRPEETSKLDLFIMSQCPFGMKAAEAMTEIVKALPDLDVNVWYLANEAGDGFSSMHGQEEVNEDIRQVCIENNEPEKFWDYLNCIAPVYRNAGNEWENCAEKAGIDKEQLDTCWQGEEGKNLLKENIAFGNSLGFGSSPTFLVNGRYIISGMPRSGAEGIKSFVCTLNQGMVGCNQTLSQGSDQPTGSCG